MTAILSITLDKTNSVEVRFKGEEYLELPMLGTLKIAEQYLLSRLNKRMAKTEDETCKTKNGIYNWNQEKVVPKQEALWFYLDLRQTIEDRLQAIATADDTAQFQVDESLSHKI